MRISVLKDDPGFHEFAKHHTGAYDVQTRVFVDGVPIYAAFTADEELGFVLAAKTRVNDAGNIEVCLDEDGEIKTEILNGKVRIEIAKGGLQ